MPDIITMAKGLTNAAVPMGAVAVHDRIYDTIVDNGARRDRALSRLHLFGPPAGRGGGDRRRSTCTRARTCSARARAIEPYFEDAVHSLRDLPNVIDVRNMGLVAGIELRAAPRQADRAGGARCSIAASTTVVLIRTTGDIIALSPPLIVEKPHLDRIFETLGAAIQAEAA